MGNFHNEHEPLGGKLVSKTTVVCAVLAAIAVFLLAKRMVLGLGSGDVHEKAAPKYLQHVYGEKEVGGTQFRFMSSVDYEKLGMPNLRDRSYPADSEGIQHTLYSGMIAPAVVFAGLVWAAKRASHVEDEHPEE